MEKETIEYKGQKYHRYPNSSRRQLRFYFWRHSKWKEAPQALHREIWKDNFGDIPKGFVVHHKDDNTLNNDISNLELLSNSKHHSLHMMKPEKREWSRQHMAKVARQCKDNVKYIQGPPQKANCVICGKEFTYTVRVGAKYCSSNCACKAYRMRKKQPILFGRPEHSFF